MASFPNAKYTRSQRAEVAETALRANKWDTEAWDTLLQEVNSQPIEKVRVVYDTFFEQFPTAVKFWRNYISREMQAKNFEKVENILHGKLLLIPHSHLWQSYIDYVRATKGREEIQKAYEFALDTIGSDVNSTTIWLGYFDFMKQLRCNGDNDENQLLNCRKRFKQVLEYQVHRLEEFWRMFELFENENCEKLYPNPRQPGDDKAASQQHIRDFSSKYKRSLVCYKEKQVLRQYLLEDMLPLPMDVPSSPFKTVDGNPPLAAPNLMQNPPKKTREQLQLSLWVQLLQYEKCNNQKLEKAEHAKRVQLMYQQAILCLYYTPEIWIQAAAYSATIDAEGVKEAIKLYDRGCKCLPASALLHISYAEFLHVREMNDKAEMVYRRFIESAKKTEGMDSTLLLIHYLHFTHKVKGLEAARQLFVQVKGYACWQFFTAMGQLEWKSNKQPVVARNIFEAGMQQHSGNLKFVMTYMEFLEAQNDENNLRLLFEKIIAQHDCPEVWAKYLQYNYRYTGAERFKEVEQRAADSCQQMRGTVPLRCLVNRYKFLDLSPITNQELTALQCQELLKMSLARYVGSRLDISTFTQLYPEVGENSETLGQAVPTLAANGDLPAHKNPFVNMLGPRVTQPNFSSLPEFTPLKNPTPPDPSQDQLSEAPCIPVGWAKEKKEGLDDKSSLVVAQVKREPGPIIPPIPPLAGLAHPAQVAAQMAQMMKQELKPVKLEDGDSKGPGAPGAPTTAELPSQLAKLLSVLPPPTQYHGPLADVEKLLDLLVENTLPAPPVEPTSKGQPEKRPLNDDAGPQAKRPTFDIYAQRQAMKLA
uniref:Suppressor of forked domain-containing protein n=1 Tax=Eutreptiella gymnastica TaxID=73025 RepID=A0A7S1I663_9EUGL